jgi:hypothetical protein
MNIHCPKCGAVVVPDSGEFEAQQARCAKCGETFGIPQAMRAEMVQRVIGLSGGRVPPNMSAFNTSPAADVSGFSSGGGSSSGFSMPIWFGIIFASFASIFVSIGITTLVQQRYRLETYQPVPAQVLSAKVVIHTTTGKNGGTTYAPVISYTYTVGGHRYTSKNVMPGLNSSGSSNWAQSVVDQYRPRTKTTAWYCAADPSKVFLLHRLDEGPYVFALFPALFVVLGIVLAISSHIGARPAKPMVADGHGRFKLAEAGTIRGRFRMAAAATLVWYGYCAMLLLDYGHINGPDKFDWIAGAICAAVGLFGVYFTNRYWQQSHDFLDAEITLSQPQIRPGDTIQFRIRQGILQSMEIEKLSIGVVCMRDNRNRYGNKTSYSTDEAWSHWLDLPVNRYYPAGGMIDMQGELLLAAFVSPSSPHRGWQYPRLRWHIGLKVCPQMMRPLEVRYPITVASPETTPPSAETASGGC